MAKPSESHEALILLDQPQDYPLYLNQLLDTARLSLSVLNTDLSDPYFFDASIVDKISEFLRAHARAQCRILVRDAKPLLGQHHRLVELSKRLPSKLSIRELNLDAPMMDMEAQFIIGDKSLLLWQHDKRDPQGFFNAVAKVECQPHINAFDDAWNRHSHEIADLRQWRL